MTALAFITVVTRVIEVLLELMPKTQHVKSLVALEGWLKRRRETVQYHEQVNAEVAAKKGGK